MTQEHQAITTAIVDMPSFSWGGHAAIEDNEDGVIHLIFEGPREFKDTPCVIPNEAAFFGSFLDPEYKFVESSHALGIETLPLLESIGYYTEFIRQSWGSTKAPILEESENGTLIIRTAVPLYDWEHEPLGWALIYAPFSKND